MEDKFSLSDEAYNEMSMLSQSLPRSNRLKDLMRQLNTKYNMPPPNDGGVLVVKLVNNENESETKSNTS